MKPSPFILKVDSAAMSVFQSDIQEFLIRYADSPLKEKLQQAHRQISSLSILLDDIANTIE